MHKDVFRMLIAGPSGSGKTNLLVFMPKTPLLYYDKVFLHARNLEQEKSLMEGLGSVSKKVGYDVLE